MDKISTFLRFDGRAEEAARFYTSLCADSRTDGTTRSTVDYPGGEAGDVGGDHGDTRTSGSRTTSKAGGPTIGS